MEGILLLQHNDVTCHPRELCSEIQMSRSAEEDEASGHPGGFGMGTR